MLIIDIGHQIMMYVFCIQRHPCCIVSYNMVGLVFGEEVAQMKSSFLLLFGTPRENN